MERIFLIEELVEFLNADKKDFLKAVVYSTDKGIAIALVRGDRDVEEVKLKNNLGCIDMEMATPEQILSIGSVAGFVGARDLKDVIVVADNDVKNMMNFVIGANKTDYHYINTNLEDIKVDYFADIKTMVSGDLCPKCGGRVRTVRGIEVGHIFKLGTRYSKALECKFLDENGKEQYMIMGCYGIGVSRTFSALVEQNCDEKGIVWPEIVAPYKLHIVVANTKDDMQSSVADRIYDTLNTSADDILLDDRKESFGVKLNDADLDAIIDDFYELKEILDEYLEGEIEYISEYSHEAYEDYEDYEDRVQSSISHNKFICSEFKLKLLFKLLDSVFLLMANAQSITFFNSA